MKILIVRHAPAGDRAVFSKTGKSDSKRELTSKGRRKMKKAAKGLRRILPCVDLIATSPLTRAEQTARILSRAYAGARTVEIVELSPGGSPESVLRRLQDFAKVPTLALVGHEPYLSALAATLLAGGGDFKIDLKKGAACLIDFSGAPKAGAGTLLWSLTPSQLRKLAG